MEPGGAEIATERIRATAGERYEGMYIGATSSRFNASRVKSIAATNFYDSRRSKPANGLPG
jgi:hypothetical protein